MDSQYIIDNIKHIIDKKGLKKTHIAKASGMTAQQLTDILAGRKVFRVEYLAPLAGAMGVDTGQLLIREEKEKGDEYYAREHT